MFGVANERIFDLTNDMKKYTEKTLTHNICKDSTYYCSYATRGRKHTFFMVLKQSNFFKYSTPSEIFWYIHKYISYALCNSREYTSLALVLVTHNKIMK